MSKRMHSLYGESYREQLGALEGSAQQGCAEQSGGGGQAGGHELANGGVHGAVGRQAARLGAQLSEQVEALCMRSVSISARCAIECCARGFQLNRQHLDRANP